MTGLEHCLPPEPCPACAAGREKGADVLAEIERRRTERPDAWPKADELRRLRERPHP